MVQTSAKWLVLLAGLWFFIGECPMSLARNDDLGVLNQQVLQLYPAGKVSGGYSDRETSSLLIERPVLGPEHPDTSVVNNLGALYEGMGDYAGAEPLYQQALQITKKVLGSEHLKTCY